MYIRLIAGFRVSYYWEARPKVQRMIAPKPARKSTAWLDLRRHDTDRLRTDASPTRRTMPKGYGMVACEDIESCRATGFGVEA
jgi:hypothetical protein